MGVISGVLRAALACALLAGCGVFDYFDEEETLPGERIRIRELASRDAQAAATLTALPLPQATRNTFWSQTNGLPSHAAGHLAGPSGLSVAWTADAGTGSGDDGRITSAPVAANGVIFAMDAEARVVALDAGSGARRWESDVSLEGEDGEEGFGGGLALGEGVLVVTTGFGEVLGLDPSSGAVRWRQALGAPVRAAPAVVPGLAVVVTRDNTAYGVDPATGTVVWRLQGVAAGAGVLGGASPAISGALAVLPFSSGEIVGAEAASGRRVWSAVLSGGRRGLARASISDISGDPVISGSTVVAANQSGRMVAIDGRSGARLWTRTIGAFGPIWAAGDTVFVMADDGKLTRLVLANGQTLWETQLPLYEDEEDREDPVAYSGPVVAGGRVLVTSSEGDLIAFDALTGQEVGRLGLGDGSVTGPIVVDGTIYVLDDDATLYAIR